MLSAICMVCGEEASRTQRLVDGRPASASDPLVVIGGIGDSATRPAAGSTRDRLTAARSADRVRPPDRD